MTIQYITSSCIISKGAVYKDEKLVFENREAGLVDFFTAAYRHFEPAYPKFYKMDNLSRLGWIAAEVLLKDHLKPGEYRPEDVAIVLSNANASLDTDIRYYESTRTIASPALFVYTLPNIVIGEISIRHHLKGENAFFISDKFDAGFIEQYVSGLLNNNILQACICGWVEILDDQYKSVLFLIEKDKPAGREFTKENLNKIYELENG